MIIFDWPQVLTPRLRGLARPRLRLTGERGFTLLEVIVVGFIMAIAMIGLGLMFGYGASYVSAEGGDRIAIFLAQQRMEELRTIGLATCLPSSWCQESQRAIPGFPGFVRTTTVTLGTDLDGAGDFPRVITVTVTSTIRQAGPMSVTTAYVKH